MSSTNRGGTRETFDNYPTPAWPVDRLFENDYFRSLINPTTLFEPSVGEGAIVRSFNKNIEQYFSNASPQWITCDIRKDVEATYNEDYLCLNLPISSQPFSVIATNPPFSLAEEFLKKALSEGEVIIFLLRLNWLGSAERNDLLRERTPDIFVIPDRVIFRPNSKGKKQADSCEYAWFVWRKKSTGKLTILKTTPKEVRNLQYREIYGK